MWSPQVLSPQWWNQRKDCQEDFDGADWLRQLEPQMSQPRRIFMSKGPAQECITHPPPALAFTAGRRAVHSPQNTGQESSSVPPLRAACTQWLPSTLWDTDVTQGFHMILVLRISGCGETVFHSDSFSALGGLCV